MSFVGLTLELAPKAVLIAAVVGGALMCFFGARLLRLALGLAGFAGGALIAAYVAWRVTAPAGQVGAAVRFAEIVSAMAQASNPATLLAWAAVGGVLGAVLSVLVQWVGMFVLGVWLGIMLGNAVMAGATTNSYLTVLAICGLAGGLLAVVMRRTILVISTAFNGAFGLMFGVYALLKEYSPHDALTRLRLPGTDALVVIGCTLLLGVIGAYVQFVTGSPAKKETQ